MLHRGFAGLAVPCTLTLAVSKAGPGKDIVISQVEIYRVHCKLADELQQASQAVKQPLQERTGWNKTGQPARHYLTEINYSDAFHWRVLQKPREPHHCPRLLVFGLQDG